MVTSGKGSQDRPERVGRYEILLPIASGGMATVYLARSRGAGGFERDVALKLTHAHILEDSAFAADLLEEAKLTVRIRHRNVVSVLDVGQDARGLFLVMDYVEGDTLANLRRRAEKSEENLAWGVGLRILVDALHGLHATHELCDDDGRSLEVVHRDFSPQNILVATDGTALLTDFGIARATTRLGHTLTGVVKGKVAYMSPDQLKGGALDRRSDVWAAGVIAWELLTGRRLYSDDNNFATMLKIVTETPPRMRSVVPDIPPALDDAVAHALTMESSDRCCSAADLARDLTLGARAFGGLADHDDVARCVRVAVDDKLRKRRKRVAQILELRATMGRIADSSVELGNPSSSLHRVQTLAPGASPPIPPPLVSKPSSSDFVRAVDEFDCNDELPDAPTRARTISASFDSNITSTTPVGTRTPRAHLAASGIAVLLAVAIASVGGVLAVRGSGADGESAAAGSSTDVKDTPTSRVAGAALPKPQVVDEPPASASISAETRSLKVVANAPLASLRVGTRAVTLGVGVTEVLVSLSSEERKQGVLIEAVATDGRQLSKHADAATKVVSLSFVHHASSKRKSTQPLPLATNPY